jgi:hypothetical protein
METGAQFVVGKWQIIFVPSRLGLRRGWLVDRASGDKYTFSVVRGEVQYLRVFEPRNIPKRVSKLILENVTVITPSETREG